MPCSRTQQTNLPACFPQPPLNAERQAGKLWIPFFKVFWYDSTRGLNPRSTDCEADALTTTPSRGRNEYHGIFICYKLAYHNPIFFFSSAVSNRKNVICEACTKKKHERDDKSIGVERLNGVAIHIEYTLVIGTQSSTTPLFQPTKAAAKNDKTV